ncbi:hypothetical protein F5880DRAFT_1619818 [Lentinula raphanica]|nr:hypothetical protein F5880DRAFT_1619818 [Lentinula raphanica]
MKAKVEPYRPECTHLSGHFLLVLLVSTIWPNFLIPVSWNTTSTKGHGYVWMCIQHLEMS